MRLRKITLDDLDALVNCANDWEIAKNMTDRFPHPYTLQEGIEFIKFCQKHKPAHVLGIDVDGAFIGAVGVHPQDDVYRKNAELGYWVARKFWGKGIATEAVRQMVDYGFGNFDIDRIFGRVYGSNVASQKVLEKLGFTLEAKFERTIYKKDYYEDEWVYGIRRGQ